MKIRRQPATRSQSWCCQRGLVQGVGWRSLRPSASTCTSTGTTNASRPRAVRLHRAHCPVTRRTAAHAPPDRARIARRLTLTLRVVVLPHALPHARRADRPIKKKTQGKRNLPANEAVSKWLIIETLERATPEEIVQLAFVVCA